MILIMNDTTKSLSITTSGTLDVDSQVVVDVNAALNTFNTVSPISTVTFSSNVCVITLKDSRSLTYTQTLGANPPKTITANIVSSSSWSSNEYDMLQELAKLLTILELQYSVTDFSVTYN